MITIGIDPSAAEKGNGVAVYDNAHLVSLDMSSFKEGTYIVKTTSTKSVEINKLIIK